jgi:cytochrome c oxidase subunit IV
MSQQIVPVKTYLFIFAGLIGLTLLTTGVAFIDLGPFNTVAALAIAFSKMLLVVFFFMHLRHSSNLVKVVLLAGFFWLALLIVLTSTDYRSRSWMAAPESWSTTAPPTHP